MRVSKTSDAIHKRVSFLIYGSPKIGKTSLVKTLPVTGDDKLLYIGADPGQLVLRDRNFTILETSDGEPLGETFFEQAYAYAKKNASGLEWVVVDGVDEIADAILASKLKTQRDGRRAYGEMADYTEDWMKRVRDIKKTSVIFITHMDRVELGEGEIGYMPQFPGNKIQKSVNGWFDEIGCMRFVTGEAGKLRRVIQFNPEVDPKYLVGDRSGALGMYEDPDLGVIFKKIHGAGLITADLNAPEEKPMIFQSDEKMLELSNITLQSGLTNSKVIEMSIETYGRRPRNLADGELAQLTDTIIKLKEN